MLTKNEKIHPGPCGGGVRRQARPQQSKTLQEACASIMPMELAKKSTSFRENAYEK